MVSGSPDKRVLAGFSFDRCKKEKLGACGLGAAIAASGVTLGLRAFIVRSNFRTRDPHPKLEIKLRNIKHQKVRRYHR